jgi:PEGA domain
VSGTVTDENGDSSNVYGTTTTSVPVQHTSSGVSTFYVADGWLAVWDQEANQRNGNFVPVAPLHNHNLTNFTSASTSLLKDALDQIKERERQRLALVQLALSGASKIPARDILKSAERICPEVWITQDETTFDYKLEVAKLDHSKGGRFSLTLLNPNGSTIREVSGGSLDDAIGGICHAVDKGEIPGGVTTRVTNKPAESIERAQDRRATPASANAPDLSPASASAWATISVSSNPDGADVYTDGEFVGNAPATLKLSAGKHSIKITLAGYQDWSRDITTLVSSEAHLTAKLEKREP